MIEGVSMRSIDLDKTLLVRMYRDMVRVRTFEERVRDLYAGKRLPGFVHLSIGQEACAVGVCSALRPDDYIITTHRGHGHMVAKGASVDRMMAELYGKRTGSCKGKGGSMHIADFSIGVLGANGVVGGGFPIAAGVGLSIKLRKTDLVIVSFFGDGGANRGTFHEAANMAGAWKLPVIFFCENNGWASTTSHRYSCAVQDIADRARGYNMPGVVVDGMDVLAVHEVATQAIRRARGREGPSLIEAKVIRWQGHYEGDPQGYRSREEVGEGRERCPIARLGRLLEAWGLMSAEAREGIAKEAQAELDRAVAFAEASPFPVPEEALEDLYVHFP
jgi:TPP-dependent pyruvate/acetoin dehydrogenase alpha subunit